MAIYENLPVYQDSYKLLLMLTGLMHNVKRDFRYTLGERLQRKATDMMIGIYRANKATVKSPSIAYANECLMEVKLLCRMLCDTKQISLPQHAQTMELTVSIGKQLSAWESAARHREERGTATDVPPTQ